MRVAAHDGDSTTGVIFVIGSAFCVDGSGHDRVRLSFSWPTPDRIREGVRAARRRDKTG